MAPEPLDESSLVQVPDQDLARQGAAHAIIFTRGPRQPMPV